MKATCWDQTGNRMAVVDLQIGDDVDWKRNGTAGTFQATVVRITAHRAVIRIRSHDGIPRTPYEKAIKPEFSRIRRNGIQLP